MGIMSPLIEALELKLAASKAREEEAQARIREVEARAADSLAFQQQIEDNLYESSIRAAMLLEAGKKMVKAYDDADEAGLMSDHGDHDLETEGMMSCPGCRCDVYSEELREATESTSPAIEEWQERRDAEVRRKVWEEAAKMAESYSADAYEFGQKYTAVSFTDCAVDFKAKAKDGRL